MSKLSIAVVMLAFASLACAEVFIDPTIRPCEERILSEWLYTPTPVEAPGTSKLPFTCDGNIKVYEVTAGIVMSSFDQSYEPGPVYTWGYNGSNPGPVMEFLEGETIRVIFKNELPESTTLHYHGLEVPFNQDGAEGHSQISVKPGETFVYEFTVNQNGTYMYHSGQNISKQLSMGLVGFLIVHPKAIPETLVDHDFLYFLQMYSLPPHSIFPDVMEMVMFNYFTFNGKVSPYTPSPLTYVGQKARMRFANMSMMEHPVHLHGHTWRVAATGAGDNPRSAHTFGNTILVPTAQTMDVIIDEIDTPGEWMFHCHLPHHVTNNMDVDSIPGEPMHMENGGMHAVFKVFRGPNDPGYVNPNVGSETGGTHGGGHGGGHGGMAPKFTTYDGEMKLSNNRRLNVTLELYKAQEDKEWRKAKAYLKVYLSRDEFMTLKYEQVKYNFETGIMSLEGDEKSITLSDLRYSDQGDYGTLSGDVRVDFGSLSGTISLDTRDADLSDIKLRSDYSITGEYEALCDGKKQSLQLLTARGLRSSGDQNDNPLASFALYGTLGIQDARGTQVSAFVAEGLYNPFRGNLRLQMDTAGNRSSLICETIVKSNKLTELKCENGCQYVKKSGLTVANEKVTERAPFAKDETPIISELTQDKEVSGNYQGILNLSRNNEVIPLSLNIIAKRYAANMMVITRNQISGTAELLFAGKLPMSFKLKERTFLDSSAAVNNNKNLLLFESTQKLSLIINRWSKTMIYGEAYHDDFGFLGEFVAKRNLRSVSEVLTTPTALKTVSRLEGSFKNAEWKLELTSPEIEDGTGSGIFSPLHIKGRLTNSSGAMTVNFVSGSYDFALGIFYVETDDGRILKGSIRGDDVTLFLMSRPMRRSNYLNLQSSKLELRRF